MFGGRPFLSVVQWSNIVSHTEKVFFNSWSKSVNNCSSRELWNLPWGDSLSGKTFQGGWKVEPVSEACNYWWNPNDCMLRKINPSCGPIATVAIMLKCCQCPLQFQLTDCLLEHFFPPCRQWKALQSQQFGWRIAFLVVFEELLHGILFSFNIDFARCCIVFLRQ